MAYIIRREPVRYTNGELSPVAYYMGMGLMFINVTENIDKAARFRTKAEAKEILRGIDKKRYSIMKI